MIVDAWTSRRLSVLAFNEAILERNTRRARSPESAIRRLRDFVPEELPPAQK